MPVVVKLLVVVDLTIDSAGDCAAVTVAITCGDVVVPVVAVAVLTIDPASMLACVVTAIAEHVSVAFGASPPAGTAGQVTLAILLSAIDSVADAGIVTLPRFLTM